jgi:hypothetical protein
MTFRCAVCENKFETGVGVYICDEKCVKKFEENRDYYIKRFHKNKEYCECKEKEKEKE